MPRKLPWATKDSPVVREKQQRSAPQKREASSDNERADGRSSKSSRSVEGSKKRAIFRTPSTSPPPTPPDEEYMIEGYNHDDIYIMVEDEFHSIAQTFTQHLHHAEYQRLKKKAKDAPPPTFQPTEAMRAEARKKMQARALQARQKDALGNITNGINLSAEDDEEQEDDPWLGTSLAGLMTEANNQRRTALVGLDKIQSSTRAAKGFGRGTGDSPPNRKEKMSVSDIFGAYRKGEQDVPQGNACDSSDIDLYRPTKATPLSSKAASHKDPGSREAASIHKPISEAPSTSTSMTESSSSDPNAAHSTHRSRIREPSVAARRLFDDFDKFDSLDKATNVTKKPRPSPSRKERNSKPAKDNKLRLSDIPTFLV